MNHDTFFFVEDSLNDRFEDASSLVHGELSKSDYLEHFDLGGLFKSKSKYKGGFKKGKNTKEYNHDYYIHNKDKWKKENQEMTLDELKALGLTDEEIEAMNLDKNAQGLLIVPTSWLEQLAENGMEAVSNFINGIKDTWLSLFGKKDDEKVEEPMGPESPFLKDPKTLDDPQNAPLYEMELEDQTGRTEKADLTFDHADYYEDFAIKDKPASVLEDCAAINPHYPVDSDGNPTPEMQEIIDNITTMEDYVKAEEYVADYTQNCGWCSYTYELRRRGYDVQAPADSEGLFNSDIAQFYKDVTLDDFKIPEDITENRMANSYRLFHELAREGNGARGTITVRWDDGTGRGTSGGHAMAWEVIDGEAYIIDAQTNTVMNKQQFYKRDGYRILWNYNELAHEYYNISPSQDKEFQGCTYLRTDDKELNTSGTITPITINTDLANNVWIEDSENVIDLGSHIVSNEPTELSKETWAKLKKYKKVKKTRKKQRKRDVY